MMDGNDRAAIVRQALQSFGDLKIEKLPTDSIRIRLISQEFVGLDDYERCDFVNARLQPCGLQLGSLEISGYILVTPEEAARYPDLIDFPVPPPTWSGILSAPEPEKQPALLDDSEKKPLVVTFYSFKGGVGRSTSLAIVGGLLAARGRRVVMIDFDLEAPGLTSSLAATPDEPAPYGVLDYIYQRWIQPATSSPGLEDCFRRVGNAANPLFLIPAGRYDQQYIPKLADFEVAKYYRRDPNPIRQLIDDTGQRFSPDVILIDARTGFDDLGAAALLDLADLGIVCFLPNRQSYLGLEWVTQAARKQQDLVGRPNLRFVLTPMPATTPEDRQNRLAQAEEWISEHWVLDPAVIIEEMYTYVNYDPEIAVIEDLFSDLPEPLTVKYKPIVDWIDASLPDAFPLALNGAKVSQPVLNELNFQTVTAEQIQPERIPDIFQRTGDFPKFIQNSMSLIRGAKGSGKSLLFRLFVEQPERARELASVYGDLSNVEFIGAHGRRALDRWIASSQVFASVEECVGDEMWRSFWPAYALLRLARTLPDLRPVIKKESSFAESLLNVLEDQNLSEEGLIQALANAVQTSAARAAANDWMQIANQWLGRQNKHAWLFYDELDAGFGHTSHDYRRRRRALEGLLAWWLEYSGPLTHIHMKCLLREDIWQELRFPNLSHYAGKDMTLQWQEEDLWRLVLRQALASSAFAREVAHLVIDREALDRLDVDQLRKALIPLWGERMGAGKAAYTYRWVLRRITDGRGSRFPRSLVLLLSQALEQERQNRQSPGKSILKPRSLVAAMDAVSMSRVQEVKEEYPELQTALEALRDSSSPMDKPGLDQVLAGFDRPPEEIIEQMLKAGILEKRKPREDNRYAIAELYLFGLGMRRKGPG